VVKLDQTWPAVGKSLKQISLRGRSGATVIALHSTPDQTTYPDADERLLAGDVLVLTGNKDSVEQAKAILGGTNDAEKRDGVRSESTPTIDNSS
jgi:monovalent cation:H+ antiporter-2, CPA2 family